MGPYCSKPLFPHPTQAYDKVSITVGSMGAPECVLREPGISQVDAATCVLLCFPHPAGPPAYGGSWLLAGFLL